MLIGEAGIQAPMRFLLTRLQPTMSSMLPRIII